MWGGAGPDPGGPKGESTSSGPPANQELMDLKDQFEQQQVLIAQLKEMLRKTEQTTVTQEKVEEYANTLTRMSARARKSKLRREGKGDSHTEVITLSTTKTTTLDSPASEKIMLLRQQLEENKLKLAERGKFQKGIEETVTQLKAQLDDSQQLISQTPLNLSLTERRTENYSMNSSPEELFNLVVSRDRKLVELNAKIQKLEANVLDLQENLKEKDSVIDARTKAITLMTESLSKKGKNTLDALDDTKEQMRKMQENFVALEIEMKNEKQQLLTELEQKNNELDHLREANTVLEKTSTEQLNEIGHLSNLLEKHRNDLANYEVKFADPTTSSVATANTEELNSQIEALNNRIVELEGLNSELSKSIDAAPRNSPQRSSKKGKKGQKVQSSGSKESDDSESRIAELQKMVDDTKAECEKHLSKVSEYKIKVNELNLTIEELKAKQETPKPVVQSDTKKESEEVAKLKKQLDESNKNMIKIKAQHKSKVKELNKKIDDLKKGGDFAAEILRLQDENSKLNERIDMLEEAKASSGLDDGYTTSIKDSAATERVKELEIKLIDQFELLEQRNQSIISLEEQINSYKTEIAALTKRFEKLSHLENAQVVSEITSIHFEEQLDKLEMEKKELMQEKEAVIQEKEALLEKLDILAKDKQEIAGKLDHYMQENMELIDKLEKLSAEKVSSAESIEIVEGLTQQEKLELEAYQKSLEMTSENIKNSEENLEQNPELNESVNQLTEETSDLLRKIELFTEERREVMEKMEALGSENSQLTRKVHEVENNRDILADTYEQLQNEKEDLENKLEQEKKRIKDLETSLHNKISELKTENEILKEKLGDHDIKHGSEVEETMNLETVTPLTEASEPKTADLQQHIDEYKSLIEIQKQEIQELKLELLSQKDLLQANNELHEKVKQLQLQHESLLSENANLRKTVKESSETVHEKDAIESELIAAKKRISEFDEKLRDNLDEIENYKSVIEENKSELISSANLITELRGKLNQKESEISNYENEILHLRSVIGELNGAIIELDNDHIRNSGNNEALELMSDQLQELKALLSENIKQIEVYERELQQNSFTISELNAELKVLNNKLLEMEHELECKDDEIKKLAKERDNKETMIANMQDELKQKDENFNKVCETLKEKYLSLQNQIEKNAGSLDDIKNPLSKVEELESKNKDQLEKMKKIAANLKRKTVAYQELEEKYKQQYEKWETEEKDKVKLQEVVQTQEIKITESQNKIDSLLEQLHEMEKEFSNLQSTLTVKSNEFQSLSDEAVQLKAENEELQNLQKSYDLQLSTITNEAEMRRSDESNNLNREISEKNAIINDLNQQLEAVRYSSETSSNALHVKIQELELFIETQELELTKYKDKVNKLEEGLSTVEERRLSLERTAMELGAQLQEKSNSYEEISQTEDLLEQRLAALMVHDEKIEKRLQEAVIENQELIERNRFLVEENDQLKHKLSAATEKNLDATCSLEKLAELEGENARLKTVLANLESENKRLHVEYEKKLSDKKNEVEAMEVELQGQLEQLDNERKTLLMQVEQLHDQLKQNFDNQELLKEEIEQHKQKLEQQQIDFDNNIIEFEKINAENKKNLAIIEQLRSNESSEQGDISKRVEDLEKLLAEKNCEIENYQKQNFQLQTNENFNQNQQFHIFVQSLQNQTDTLEMQTLTSELHAARSPLAEVEKINSKLQTHNSELLQKVQVSEKENRDNKVTKDISQKSAQIEGIATFVWPETESNDPFDFVLDPAAAKPDSIEPPVQATPQSQVTSQTTVSSGGNFSENSKEELLKKIKVLEFMLYNMEKEKEDVLLQCQELTNEVARLIYERHNSDASNTAQVESQICSQSDTILMDKERQQLKKVEFSPAKDNVDTVQVHAVMEEIIEPTTTYLCYKPDAIPDHSQDLPPPPHQLCGYQGTVEEQIVPIEDTVVTQEDLKQLQPLEFVKTKPCKDVADTSQAQPVDEDVLEPRTAYLCYQMEAPPDSTDLSHQLQEYQQVQVASLESQIVSSGDTSVTNEDRQLHDVEFEKRKDLTDASNSTFQPHKSGKAQEPLEHQSYPAINLDAFDDNDDGWCCGLEEARLEEDYRQSMSNPSLNQNFNLHIEQLDEKVRALEIERERHLEEIRQAQIKSGKLIKKLKEFKALNEKLSSDMKKSSDFGGLDDAIHDELQNQIVRLEKRIKDTSAELEREKTDKSNLLKKIDVLQAANERMIDMKEKQDVEMLSWQRQNRELSAKLEQLEWGDDGFDSPKHGQSEQQRSSPDLNLDVPGYEKKIQKLSHTIKELTLDNEELQAMLEEQRVLRINAEKAKSVEPIPENMKTEAEYLSIVAEKNYLNDQLALSSDEKKDLQEQLNNLIKNNGELQHKLQILVKEKSLLENHLSENKQTTQDLTVQLENLQKQNEGLLKSSEDLLNSEVDGAKTKIAALEQENFELGSRLRDLETTVQQLRSQNTNLLELQSRITELNQEKTELFSALQEKNIQIENLTESVTKYDKKIIELEEKLSQSESLVEENDALTKKLQLKGSEVADITIKLEAALEERSTLSASIQQLAEEWNQRVDQRGTDVAESWKLHLESRETEFMQVEQQLRKEINELEEKCNALVNENNELRKNVDAEIRNEVDKISALQQQINDRQRYINDLTHIIQENQTELEQQRQKLTECDGIITQLKLQGEEKDAKLIEAETRISALQLEIEEKSKIIEELTYKLSGLQLLQQQLEENQQTVANLQHDLNKKQNSIDEYLTKLDKSTAETVQYKNVCTLLQQQLQDKEIFNAEMANKLKQTQEQKESENNNTIEVLHQQIRDLTSQLQEKQSHIDVFNHQAQSYQQVSEIVEAKDIKIKELSAEITNLHSLLSEKENVNIQLQEKQAEVDALKNQMYDYQQLYQSLETKEAEINQLNMEISQSRTLLSEKEKEYAHNLATTAQESENVFTEKTQELDAVKRRQAETESHYEELFMAKDADTENLRLQLQEQTSRNEELIRGYQEQCSTLNEFKVQLDLKVQEYEDLQSKIYEQNELHSEANGQISELRQIIEDQVLKIEALKQEVFEKSKDYDSLIAELDIRKPSRLEPDTPVQEHQEQLATALITSKTTPKKYDAAAEEDTLEPISRAELDLALYMLHQRDVRCEELTVELMQLLEERDTLQLKLSNAIREKEELRNRFLPLSTTPESTETAVAHAESSPAGAVPKSKASAIVLGATGTELATEATESLQGDPLANKLSELKSVGYRKDKTLLDEQEQRRFQQLSLMQQHRDVAAMLPPEAAARLVQEASYTLSRDVQSPSKVLLNWLWGRSTPKVNNV